MKGLAGVFGDEFGDVDGFDVIQDRGAHDGFLKCGAIAEVVALGEVAAVVWVAFFGEGEVEVGLADVVLVFDFLLGEAVADDAEEACFVNLLFGNQCLL